MVTEPTYYDLQDALAIGTRRDLPHWTAPGAAYFVTFRLADSIPGDVQRHLRDMRKQVERYTACGDAAAARRLEQRLIGEREACLDKAFGSCTLRHPEEGGLVFDSLLHFEGDRYDTYACCVMPNHAHTVFRPLGAWTLSKIVQSWKGFTAHELVKLLGTSGQFWQHESFDHMIRSRADLDRFMRYVVANPKKGGLGEHWPWVYCAEVESRTEP